MVVEFHVGAERSASPGGHRFAVHLDDQVPGLQAGFGRETVTGMLNRLENVEELSLADNPAFRTCMERCGDPHDAIRVHVHLDTDAAHDVIASLHEKVAATSPVGHTLTHAVPITWS